MLLWMLAGSPDHLQQRNTSMPKITLLLALLLLFHAQSHAQNLEFTDATTLTLYGKSPHSGAHFHRVDTARYNDMPPAVKGLSTHSAGLAIAFKTNANEIHARWEVKEPMRFSNNMTAIGKRGLDLYIRRDGQWEFAGVGRPGDKAASTFRLVNNLEEGEKECLLFLPLYDELTKLELGVPKGSLVQPHQLTWTGKVVIYGSSITQGASASRPGMAYPAQLARKLNYEFINLGFSGSGKMEESVAKMVSDIQGADLFILDCAANPSPQEIAERTENFVKMIRNRHPNTPILMIESVVREGGNFDSMIRKRVSDQNKNFRAAYTRLINSGMKELYIIHGYDLLGDDHEGTVDGTHPNDLGFARMLKVIEPKVREILNSK